MTPEEICQDLEASINFTVEFIEEDSSIQSVGEKCNAISRYYRALGICELLIEADTDAFNHHLIRSALTRKYYLQRCHQENFFADPAVRTSVAGPFLDSIAAHQLALAKEIATFSPKTWWKDEEYEDDFAYAHFLHHLLLLNDQEYAELEKILKQFENALEGARSERLEVCVALLAKDQGKFDDAFSNLIDAQEKYIAAERETFRAEDTTFWPESQIFIEGLALLGIAESRGIKTQPNYKFCPSLARIPHKKPFDRSYFPGLPL